MANKQISGSMFIVDDSTGAIVGVKLADGTERLFAFTNSAPTYTVAVDVPQGGYKVDGIATSAVKWVDVTCTATALDASTGTGKVEVIAAVAGDQYKIRDIMLVGGGTNFGAAGDRLLSLTDGTTVYTTIANADLETAPSATLAWGNTKVPFLTGVSDTATAAGAQLYFQYSGGTPATPHTTGSIKFSVCVEKVA